MGSVGERTASVHRGRLWQPRTRQRPPEAVCASRRYFPRGTDRGGMIDETVEEIEQMQTHSSSVVAVKAADALREFTDGEYPTVEEYQRTLERNASALRRANPSHASLQNAIRDVVDAVDEADPESVEEAQ